MEHTAKLDAVRKLVNQRCQPLPDSSGNEQYCETLLVRDGNYCGRRFRCESWFAVWLADEDRLLFFLSDGTHLETIPIRSNISAEDHAA